MKKPSRLQRAYTNYQKKKITKKSLLKGFLFAMPEMILRTTRLEGEIVTRKMVKALFK